MLALLNLLTNRTGRKRPNDRHDLPSQQPSKMNQQERNRAKDNALGCLYFFLALALALTIVSNIADQFSK